MAKLTPTAYPQYHGSQWWRSKNLAGTGIEWRQRFYLAFCPVPPLDAPAYHGQTRTRWTWYKTGNLRFLYHQVQLALESDSHVAEWTYPIRVSRSAVQRGSSVMTNVARCMWAASRRGAPLRNSDDNKKWTRNSGSFNHFNLIYVEQEKLKCAPLFPINLRASWKAKALCIAHWPQTLGT